jgi:hypothetical protein
MSPATGLLPALSASRVRENRTNVLESIAQRKGSADRAI